MSNELPWRCDINTEIERQIKSRIYHQYYWRRNNIMPNTHYTPPTPTRRNCRFESRRRRRCVLGLTKRSNYSFRKLLHIADWLVSDVVKRVQLYCIVIRQPTISTRQACISIPHRQWSTSLLWMRNHVYACLPRRNICPYNTACIIYIQPCVERTLTWCTSVICASRRYDDLWQNACALYRFQ